MVASLADQIELETDFHTCFAIQCLVATSVFISSNRTASF